MDDTNIILIHYGELALKGKNRDQFEDKLINNIQASLSGTRISSVDKLFGRIRIVFADRYTLKTLSDKILKVFGVASFAPAVCTATPLANIEQTAIGLIEHRQFASFAVRARRVEKKLPYTSQEVNERIGARVKGQGARVDLDNPELTIWIEILSKEAYIYIDKFKGPGGLPVGTSGEVLALISGGIDSPVAAWRMMRRGCKINFIHFHSAPFTDSASQEKVKELVEKLSKWQCNKARFVMVPFGEIQKKIVTSTPERYRVILYRRFMMRIAKIIARGLYAEALVTGESLGQVASQTLSNMTAVEVAAGLPILRPLVGMDKQEIIDTAKKIDTYDLSIIPHQDCCQFFEPRHPATRSTPEELAAVEKGLNIDELIKEGLTGAEWKDISA